MTKTLMVPGLEGLSINVPEWGTDAQDLASRELLPRSMFEISFNNQKLPKVDTGGSAGLQIAVAETTGELCRAIVAFNETASSWQLQDGYVRCRVTAAAISFLFPGLQQTGELDALIVPSGVILTLPAQPFLLAAGAHVAVQVRRRKNAWMYRLLAQPHPNSSPMPNKPGDLFARHAQGLCTEADAVLRRISTTFFDLDAIGDSDDGWMLNVRPPNTVGWPWALGLRASQAVVGPTDGITSSLLAITPTRLEVDFKDVDAQGHARKVRWHFRQRQPGASAPTDPPELVMVLAKGSLPGQLDGYMQECRLDLEPVRVREDSAGYFELVPKDPLPPIDSKFRLTVDGDRNKTKEIEIKTNADDLAAAIKKLDELVVPFGAYAALDPTNGKVTHPRIVSATRGPVSSIELSHVPAELTSALGMKDGMGVPGTGLLDAVPHLHLRSELGWLSLRGAPESRWGFSGVDETQPVAVDSWLKDVRDRGLKIDLLVDNSGEIDVMVEHGISQVTNVGVKCSVYTPAVRVVTPHLVSTGEGQGYSALVPFFDDNELGNQPSRPDGDLVADGGGRILDRLVLLPSRLVARPEGDPAFAVRMVGPQLIFRAATGAWKVVHWRQLDGIPLATPPEWALNDPRARWVPGQPTENAGPSTLRGLLPVLVGPSAPPKAITVTCQRGPFKVDEPAGITRTIYDPEHDTRADDPDRQLLTVLKPQFGIEIRNALAGSGDAIAARIGVRYGVPHLDSYFHHVMPPGILGTASLDLVRVAEAWADEAEIANLDVPAGKLALEQAALRRLFVAQAELDKALAGNAEPTRAERTKVWQVRADALSGTHAAQAADLNLQLHVRERHDGLTMNTPPIARWALRDRNGGDQPTIAGVPVRARRLRKLQDSTHFELTVVFDTLQAVPPEHIVHALPRELTIKLAQSTSPTETDVLVFAPSDLSGIGAFDASVVAAWLGEAAPQPSQIVFVEAAKIELEIVNQKEELVVRNVRINAHDDVGKPLSWQTSIAVRVAHDNTKVVGTIVAAPPRETLEVVNRSLQLRVTHPLPGMKLVETIGASHSTELLLGTNAAKAQFEYRQVLDRLYVTYGNDAGQTFAETEVSSGFCVDALTRCHLMLRRDDDSRYTIERGLLGWRATKLIGLVPADVGSAQATLVIGPQPNDPRQPRARLELNGTWKASLKYKDANHEYNHDIVVACWDSALPVKALEGGIEWAETCTFSTYVEHHVEVPSSAGTLTIQMCAFQQPALILDDPHPPKLDLSGVFALQRGVTKDIGSNERLATAIEVRRPSLVLKTRPTIGTPPSDAVALALLPFIIAPAGAIQNIEITARQLNVQTPSSFVTVAPPAPGLLPSAWEGHDAVIGFTPMVDTAFVDGLTAPSGYFSAWTLARGKDSHLAWIESGVAKIGAVNLPPKGHDKRLWILDEDRLRLLWTWPADSSQTPPSPYPDFAREMLATARWTDVGVLEDPDRTGSSWQLISSPLVDERRDLAAYTGFDEHGERVPTPPIDRAIAPVPAGVILTRDQRPTQKISKATASTATSPTSYIDLQLDIDTHFAGPPRAGDHVVVTVSREIPFEVDKIGDNVMPHFGNATPLGHDVPNIVGAGKPNISSVGTSLRYQASSPRPGELTEFRFGLLTWTQDGQKKLLRIADDQRLRVRTPQPPPGDAVTVNVTKATTTAAVDDSMEVRVVEWIRHHAQVQQLGGANTLVFALNTPDRQFITNARGVVTAFANQLTLPAAVAGAEWLLEVALAGGKTKGPLLFSFPEATSSSTATLTFTRDEEGPWSISTIRWRQRNATGAIVDPTVTPPAPPAPAGPTTIDVVSDLAVVRPPPTLIAVVRTADRQRLVAYGPDAAQRWEAYVDTSAMRWRIRGEVRDRAAPSTPATYQVISIRGDGAWSDAVASLAH